MASHKPVRSDRFILCGVLAGIDPAGFHSLHQSGAVMRLNATAARILSLCDGHRTTSDIIHHLRDPQTTGDFARMVREFLGAALRSGWIVALKPAEFSPAPRQPHPLRGIRIYLAQKILGNGGEDADVGSQ